MTIDAITEGIGRHDLASVTITVVREFDVSHARILATEMAGRIGFSASRVCRIATAVSELGSNLVLHTTSGGQLSLIPLFAGGRHGLEVLATDNGPGIPDLALAMTDGVTTNGGLGCGLPGSRRLMDEFEIASTAGEGTRVAARLWR